jgi:hypothetical protein
MHKQQLPNWGVMFNDGSVRSRWNGRTQLHRALIALEELKADYPTDNITLCYRRGPGHQWTRIVPKED